MTEENVTRLLSFGTKKPEEASKRLLSVFSSPFEVADADTARIADVLGDKSLALYIKLVAAVVSRRGCDRLKPGKVYTDAEIKDFVLHLFFGLSVETIYVLTFDSHGEYIAFDKVGEGSANYSNAMPRKFVEICNRRGAKSLIVAHNHPGGCAIASFEDISATQMLRHIFSAFGLRLINHYIVAQDECIAVE